MFSNVIVRLVTYYTAIILFIAGLMRLFPQIAVYQAQERGRTAQTTSAGLDFLGEGAAAASQTIGVSQILDPATSLPVAMAILVSFLMVLPVTWVYRWTRPRKRYSQTFAHTMLVIPIAIALVVFLVKGSLPLAFSLAGIVAAIRFRTSLSEPMDAVYMFIVIGVGLASGVQLAVVALIASVAFNIVALTVWRIDFGAQPAILDGWRLVEAGEAGQLLGVSGELTPDAAGGVDETKLYNAVLRVQTTRVEAAQRAAVPILEATAKNWRMSQVIQNEDGTSVVEFDVRLKKSTDLAAFIREIEQTEATVGNVELKKTKSKQS